MFEWNLSVKINNVQEIKKRPNKNQNVTIQAREKKKIRGLLSSVNGSRLMMLPNVTGILVSWDPQRITCSMKKPIMKRRQTENKTARIRVQDEAETSSNLPAWVQHSRLRADSEERNTTREMISYITGAVVVCN